MLNINKRNPLLGNFNLQANSLAINKYNHIQQLLQMKSVNRVKFWFTQHKIPKVDVNRYLRGEGDWQNDCRDVAQALRVHGLLVIKDPRVDAQKNNKFLDLMQRYFNKRSQQYHEGIKNIDLNQDPKYPSGLMHQFQELFQSYAEYKNKLKAPHHSLTPLQVSRDPKWRFHWNLNHPMNVIPQDFPEFKDTMNQWGVHMRNGCLTVAQMAAIGLGLDKKFLSSRIENGFFMLSPTACDLQRCKKGDVLAAFHRDFDLLTIHGKARYSGLYAWLNTGEKFLVTVPEGHLLVQAGKQLQWITGGYIQAGFHQVVYNEQVEKAKQVALKENRIAWRISSTMFAQVQNKVILQPHSNFSSTQANEKYPEISAQDYLNQQLRILTGKK